MPITEILKEARVTGETTVVVHDGVFYLHGVEGRGKKSPRQIWVFVPRD